MFPNFFPQLPLSVHVHAGPPLYPRGPVETQNHYTEYFSSLGEASPSGPYEEGIAIHTHGGDCLHQKYLSE